MSYFVKAAATCALSVGCVLCAQSTAPPAATATTETAKPAPMKLMKNSVVFIQGNYPRRSPSDRCVDSDNKPSNTCSIIGTGFLILYPEPREGENRGFAYVVTNKHMVREPGPDGSLGHGPFLKSILIRLNTKKPLVDSGVSFTYGTAPVIFDSGDLNVLVHPTDPFVDLAVIPVQLDPETLDYFTVGTSLFATKALIDEKHLDESNEVVFAGLFAPYTGIHRNYPVVRHGKLAMMSDERIPWTPGVTEDLFLADVMSFGGNSGSPVFIRTGGDNQAIGNYEYFLLGVMQGYYSVDSQVSVQTSQVNEVAKENTGIAAVVPAQKVLDILNSPRAVSKRDLEVAKFLLTQGKTTEALALYSTAVNRLTEFDRYHPDLVAAKLSYADALQQSGNGLAASQQRRDAKMIKRPTIVPDDDKK